MIFEDTTAIFKEYKFPYVSGFSYQKTECFNHCHKELEIIYVVRGSIIMINGRSTFQMKKDDVYIVKPYSNHALINDNDSQWIVVIFDLDIASHAGIRVDGRSFAEIFSTLNTHSDYWSLETKQDIISIVVRMHQEYVKKTPYWPVAIKAMTSQLLVTALRNFPVLKAAPEEDEKQVANMKAAIEYIMGNYKNGASLPECAAKIGYNISYFSRFFKKNIGVPFKKYVNFIKIERAKWLLLTSQLSILDVCYESGFTDVGTFNRLFKMYVFMSPSQFRKEHLKGKTLSAF